MIENLSFEQHTHDDIGTRKVKASNVIRPLRLTGTDLTNYLALDAEEGDMFTNYDGTNYKIYVRLNNVWKSAALT